MDLSAESGQLQIISLAVTSHATTLVQVAGLVDPEMLVEIKCLARL